MNSTNRSETKVKCVRCIPQLLNLEQSDPSLCCSNDCFEGNAKVVANKACTFPFLLLFLICYRSIETGTLIAASFALSQAEEWTPNFQYRTCFVSIVFYRVRLVCAVRYHTERCADWKILDVNFFQQIFRNVSQELGLLSL